MCNLYSVTKGQDAIVAFTRAMFDRTGNMPRFPALYPDMMAPVVRLDREGHRELIMMRWGFPPTGQNHGLIINVRNPQSPYWRTWLERFRCVIPLTSFVEWEDTKPRKTPVWLAGDPTRPLMAFAGIWRPWTGIRGEKPKPGEPPLEDERHRLFALLTTQSNSVVGAIHPQAMPVILTTSEEIDQWLTAPLEEALKLQRPLPNDALQVVMRGEREDNAG